MAHFTNVVWLFAVLISIVFAHTTSLSTATTSCTYTNVVERFYQSPPVSTVYLTTAKIKSIIDCQNKGCVTNTVHVNEDIASVYFTSATTVATSTELYYECSSTSSPQHDSEARHHGLKDRNYKSTLSDVYENNRGYHRFVESAQSGSLTTVVSVFTTLSSSGPVATSSLNPTLLSILNPSNTPQSSLQTSAGSSTCTSVIGTPSPAFVMNSAPGYTFRWACGTTINDVEACPYMCGDFSPQICNAVDMSNVKGAGTCNKCPLPCPGGSTAGSTLSPLSSFVGDTFAGPTLTNMTSAQSSTLAVTPASCTSVPANAIPSAPVILEQKTWRLTCGQTVEDVVACPWLCGYFSGCDGTPNCGRACSSDDLSVQDGGPCEQCLLPCTALSPSASGTIQTPFLSVFPNVNISGPTFVSSPPSATPFPTLAVKITSITSAPSATAVPAFLSCLPALGGITNPACQPTCNAAVPSASPAVLIPGLVAGAHFRIQCGTTEEDVAQCPWLCGNLCTDDDLSKWGGGPCKKCLPPCSTLATNTTATSTSTFTTGTGLQVSTVATNVTHACTTFPATATPSPAIYDAFSGVDLFVRDGNCGTNFLEVLECPYICGAGAPRGTGGCSPRNITADQVSGGIADPVPCQQCLPPCSNHSPALLAPTSTVNATAIQPSATCVDLPPAINYVPTFFDPSMNESWRQFCGITPETSEACPWLCGYYSNPELGSNAVPQFSNPWNMATTKMCSSTNLTASFTHPVLGPIPCEKCPLVCPPRQSNPFPNIEPNNTLPVNYTIQIPKIPTFPSTCNPVQPSSSPFVYDPAVNVGYRHSCGTTVEEVEECAFLCGYPSSPLRACSPSNLTAYLAPWWTQPCEQCLLPCGTNGTANFTTAIPTLSGSASASVTTPTATALLVKRQIGNSVDVNFEKRDNVITGSDPVLARVVCPSQPRPDCAYICAKKVQEYYDLRCSTNVPTDSSIGCLTCPGVAISTIRKHRRQADPLGLLPPFTGVAEERGIELATALFIYQLYNSGISLTTACEELDVVKVFTMGLNGTTVKQFICNFATNATAPPYTSFEQDIGIAAALVAVTIAGGFAGGCNLNVMCQDIDFQLVTDLGFDGQGAKDFVCGIASGTSLASTSTATSVPITGLSSTILPTTITTPTRSHYIGCSSSKGWN